MLAGQCPPAMAAKGVHEVSCPISEPRLAVRTTDDRTMPNPSRRSVAGHWPVSPFMSTTKKLRLIPARCGMRFSTPSLLTAVRRRWPAGTSDRYATLIELRRATGIGWGIQPAMGL